MAESDMHNGELPLEGAGPRLRRQREAIGLSLADVAARTKIAERHLASIEQSRFGDLASKTYAVGFTRAYARAVGLDEAEIAQAVRDELAMSEGAREAPKADVFEPGDPARVPGLRLAWVAALGAVAVIVFVFVFWRSYFSPAVTLPELTAEHVPSAGATADATAPPPAVADAAVVFTALEPNIWIKVYDAAGNQLVQKQLAKGESYTVPADVNGPMIRTGRPDALQVSVGGRIVPRLSDQPVNVKDVPVTAAALLARRPPAPQAQGGSSPTPQPGPRASPSAAARQGNAAPVVAPTSRPASGPRSSPSPSSTPSPRPRATPAAQPAPSPAPAPAPAVAPAPEQPQTSTVSN